MRFATVALALASIFSLSLAEFDKQGPCCNYGYSPCVVDGYKITCRAVADANGIPAQGSIGDLNNVNGYDLCFDDGYDETTCNA